MITDDDIYFMWGSSYTNKGRYKSATDLWNDERKKLQSGSRQEVIEWAQKHLRNILPDEEEYIKRKDWYPLNKLVGEKQEILDDPIWSKTQKYIFENFHPTSPNLIIQRCSSQKPYIDNSNYKFTKQLVKEGLCDLAVASLDIVPIQMTVYYPFRHYDWNDGFETPELTKYAINRKTNRIIQFIDHFNYKKVLIFAPAFEGDTYYKIIYNKLNEHYKGKVQIEFVMDEKTTQACIEQMKGYHGLAKVRYSNLKPTQDRLYDLLGVKVNPVVNLLEGCEM